MREYVVYTDGGCDPNPGPGGWAALIIHGMTRRELSGAEAHSTNNRMEPVSYTHLTLPTNREV